MDNPDTKQNCARIFAVFGPYLIAEWPDICHTFYFFIWRLSLLHWMIYYNTSRHQSPVNCTDVWILSFNSKHIIMILQVTHRSWKNLKICFIIILALILLKFLFHYGRVKRHKQKLRKIPLLEQVGKNGSQRLQLKIFKFHTNF